LRCFFVFSKNYPAKLLLFGEHVLLRGASALAVPVPRFSGRWATDAQHPQWPLMADLATRLPDEGILDLARLRADVACGVFFQSDIPQGYGLGSSGALCAALLDRYALSPPPTQLADLKALLGRLEGGFHGQSSGIDPLTSWVGAPLRITQRTHAERVALAAWPSDQAPQVFLIDSRLPRHTGPLVQWFLAQCDTSPEFVTMLRDGLLPAHEATLDAWIRADATEFWPHLRILSRLQLEYLHPMVPAVAALQQLWQTGLSHPDFALKICGAGGGGFVLGFARQPDFVREWAQNEGFDVIWPFEG
jgi:mevalonate kinase